MDSSSRQELYHTPAVRAPSREEITRISASMGLTLTQEEQDALEDLGKTAAENYDKLNQHIEYRPDTKYPRTPGYRPSPEENPYNAWYYKTDIAGATSGKLAGKTVAVKDTVAVAGVPLMSGSSLMEGYVPEYDATVVTRILDAGGCIKGKAACEDLCDSGNSFTCNSGTVLNFHDKTRSAGGSSSGSATLVASGEVDLAIGGDQAGSIRIPASWSGIAGLKPTWGLVPYTGAIGADPSVDHLGPMAKTVYDCALLLEVIAGADRGLDARQPLKITVPSYTQHLTGKLDGIKVGLLTEGFDWADQEVAALVRDAADKLTTRGATVHDVSIPLHKDSVAILNPIQVEGYFQVQYACQGTNIGMKGFHPSSALEHLWKNVQRKPNHLPISMKFKYIMGSYVKENYGHHFYMKGRNIMHRLKESYDRELETFDVLILPTMLCTAKKNPPNKISPKEYLALSSNIIENTCPFNMTGHPALSVNAGFSSEHLPIGMMIVGNMFDDVTVLRVGHAYEQIRIKNC